MKIITAVLEEVKNGDYHKVEPLLHFIRSRGDIAESIDQAWEEETLIQLNQDQSTCDNNRHLLESLIQSAINSYGRDSVDIVIDPDKEEVYLSYHSSNNSFNISESYPLNRENAISLAIQFDIGWFEP